MKGKCLGGRMTQPLFGVSRLSVTPLLVLASLLQRAHAKKSKAQVCASGISEIHRSYGAAWNQRRPSNQIRGGFQEVSDSCLPREVNLERTVGGARQRERGR